MSSTDQGTNPADTDDLTPTTLSLAGDFPKATEEQWEREVEKVFNRGRPPEKQLTFAECLKRLTVHTVDGIDIVPMYRPKDAPKKLGYPGVTPFTRGTTVRNGDMDAWDVRALHEDPDEKFTRKAILEDLERGVTSLLLRVDPDAIAPEHLDEVLSDVLLEMTKVEVFSRYDQGAAAEALMGVYERSDKPAKDLALNLGLDPIGFAALQGTEPDLTVLGDWVRRLAKFSPDSRAVTIDANVYHNAGAGDVAESRLGTGHRRGVRARPGRTGLQRHRGLRHDQLPCHRHPRPVPHDRPSSRPARGMGPHRRGLWRGRGQARRSPECDHQLA